MLPQDPEALVRHQRVRRLCRELSQLLQASVEQRRNINELLSRLEAVTRNARKPLARAAGRPSDGLSRG